MSKYILKKGQRKIKNIVEQNQREHDVGTQGLNDYTVTDNTLAILPIKDIEYSSIVHEVEASYYVRQTPMKIIEAACEKHHSSYQGRRDAVISHTGSKYKTPIIIRERGPLLAFPTTSPRNFECAWLFFHHIKSTESNNRESHIQFENEQIITLPISSHCLQNQLSSTQHLHYLLTKDAYDYHPLSTQAQHPSFDGFAISLLKELLIKLK